MVNKLGEDLKKMTQVSSSNLDGNLVSFQHDKLTRKEPMLP